MKYFEKTGISDILGVFRRATRGARPAAGGARAAADGVGAAEGASRTYRTARNTGGTKGARPSAEAQDVPRPDAPNVENTRGPGFRRFYDRHIATPIKNKAVDIENKIVGSAAENPASAAYTGAKMTIENLKNPANAKTELGQDVAQMSRSVLGKGKDFVKNIAKSPATLLGAGTGMLFGGPTGAIVGGAVARGVSKTIRSTFANPTVRKVGKYGLGAGAGLYAFNRITEPGNSNTGEY